MSGVGVIGLLGLCSIEDIVKKQVHVTVVCLFGILGVLIHLRYGNLSWQDMLMGAGIGVVLYIVSILSREKIGKGDALIVGAMGVYLGFWPTMAVLWVASFFVAVIGVVFMIWGDKSKNYEMAFVPFLLVAYVAYALVGAVYA